MSKYLEAFKSLKSHFGAHYNLMGDVLIVEKIQGQELKKEVMGHDGKKKEIYLSGGTDKKVDGLDMNLPVFVRVLEVGPGYFDAKDSDLDPVPCGIDIGDIILVGRMSVNWFSVFGGLVSTASGEIGITRESEVRMRFKGQEAYDRCFSFLNHELNPKPSDCSDSKGAYP